MEDTLRTEIASLKLKIAALEENLATMRASDGRLSSYFYLCGTDILEDDDDRMCVDDERYELGNYFASYDEAQHHLDNLRTHVALKRYASDFNKEYDKKGSFALCLDINGEIETYAASNPQDHPSTVWFNRDPLIYEILEVINKKDLVQYLKEGI